MILTIGGTVVHVLGNAPSRVIRWVAGLAIDFDGAPNAYAPVGFGQPLDDIRNAGHPGNWWGIVTDTGLPSGTPIRQQPGDPYPGYFIPTTALQARDRALRDPLRYVDASTVPYISVPLALKGYGLKLGDVGYAKWQSTGRTSPFVVADIGPMNKIGEGSPALAAALGIDPGRHGGTEGGVECAVFCGSATSARWPRLFSDVELQVAQLVDKLERSA